VVERAIKALGGEEAIKKAATVSWTSKGTIAFNAEDHEFQSKATLQGLDHYRVEFQVKFGDNNVKGITVLNGDQGWSKFGDNRTEMNPNAVANEKRTIAISAIPTTLVNLKGQGFQVESVADDKVGGKPATGIKVTTADGKDFRVYFDKESHLPVKVVARVVGFNDQEFLQATIYSDYKVFDGIKRATNVSSTRDGDDFMKIEVSDFKVLDKAAPETFSQPD
jgi:hypothetical protein